MKLQECRGCSSTEFKVGPTKAFKTCLHCGGLHGRGTLAQISEVVTLEFCTAQEEKESGDFGLTFFDVDITSGNAVSCHGWFNPSTKKVHQFG
jgi:hypothetical protein